MNEDTHPISQRDEHLRVTGLIVGVVAGVGVYLLLGNAGELSEPGRRLAGVATLMACWWVTEAIPLAATALVPVILFPVLNVLPVKDTTSSYGNPLIFLFMGGLMLGKGLELWGAHKRMALMIISVVGTSPKRVVASVLLCGAVLSAFVSNTATAMMMLPIVGSIAALTTGPIEGDSNGHAARFHTCLLLALAYGCSIGGIATLMGTPPNGFMAGFVDLEMGMTMSYARWMGIGVPITVILLPICWVYMVFIALPVKVREVEGGAEQVKGMLRALGPMSRPEKTAVVVFFLTALLWISHGWLEDKYGIPKVHDASIAIFGAMLMFILPSGEEYPRRIIAWKHAQQIPWGILLLFGGGLALASGVSNTGLDSWIGGQVANLGNPGELPLLGGVCALIVFLTEMTSNTATTSTMLPVFTALAEGLGIAPIKLVLVATIGASCAFMLPVATPPNAIVFASGKVTIGQMAKVGLGLNLIAIVVITLVVWLGSETLLGLSGSDLGAPETQSNEIRLSDP
jgi:sodium-dependent dicarboxylate transporter 2/3/5